MPPGNIANPSPQDIYRLLIDSVQEYAILLLDTDGTIRNWNKGAELIKGYSAEEAVGQNFEIFFTQADRDQGLPALDLRQAREKGHIQLEGWRVRKDGSLFWANLTITALYQDQKLIGYSKVTRDLTKEKNAEREKERIEQILDRTNETARIGAWEVDLMNNKITRSRVTREIFDLPDGTTPDHNKGMDYFKEGEHRDRIHRAFREAVAHGTPYDIEALLVTATGRERWCRAIGQAEFIDGKCARVFGVIQDIDVKKRAEEERERVERVLDGVSQVARIGVWDVDLVTNTVTLSRINRMIREIPEDMAIDPEQGRLFFKEGEHRDKVQKAFQEAIRDGLSYDINVLCITASGREIWCRVIGKPEFKDGRCVRLSGMLQDVDSQIRDHIALQYKEAQFRSSFEMQGMGMALVSPQGIPILVNKKLTEILGYSREELYTIYLPDITHPDDRDKDIENLRSMLAGEIDQCRRIKRYIHKDGSIVWVEISLVLVRDDQGQPLHNVCQIEDITAQRKNTEEKARMQEILSIVSETARIGTWEVDMLTRTVTWDRVTAAIHEVPEGYQPSLEEAMNYYQEGESREIITHIFNELASSGTPYDAELMLVTAGGRDIWCRTIGQAEFIDGKCVRIFGTFQDIDVQKRTQIELQLSEEQFRRSFDLSGIGMALVNPDGWPIRVNKRLSEILGYTFDEFYAMSILDITHPDDIAEDVAAAARLLRGETDHYEITKRYFHKNGSTVWTHITVSLVRDSQRAPLHFVSEVEDITDKKKAEDDLKRVNDELTAIFNSGTHVAIIGTDLNGLITHFNKGAEELFGYKAEEVVGIYTPELIQVEAAMSKRIEEMSRKFSKPIEGFDALVEPTRHDGYEAKESVYRRKDGSTFPAHSVISSIRNEKNEIIGYLGISTDITQIKEAEAHIRKYALLEAKNKEMEEFTFIASHDLLEPLQTVSSFVGLLKEEYHDQLDADAQKYIQFISGSTRRMMELVKGLLHYSRLGKERKLEMTDMNELLREVMDDLTLTIADSHADIRVAGLPTLMVYPIECKQLFQNLITNAIKFRKPDVPLQIDISADRVNDKYTFVVSDNGIGIADRNKDRIFAMFQRLHDRHEYDGTGVGLAYCKKIVEMHNGNIWVESKPGTGSAFHFTLMTERK